MFDFYFCAAVATKFQQELVQLSDSLTQSIPKILLNVNCKTHASTRNTTEMTFQMTFRKRSWRSGSLPSRMSRALYSKLSVTSVSLSSM